MSVLVFDIETVPDVELGRRLLDLKDATDAEVAEAMFQARREKTGGSDFLANHQHKVAAISVVFRDERSFRLYSLGDPDSPEDELIRRFFLGIDKFTPTLVSWNGSSFDLPVLHYRALRHGVASPTYWEVSDRDFRYNNYLSRYHYRHLDLMDVLASYQKGSPLDEVAQLLGLPGKMGMHGGKVWEAIQQGEIQQVRDYCETDVLNTYLVYLRFQLIRGQLSQERFDQETAFIKESLRSDERPHVQAYLKAWEGEVGA